MIKSALMVASSILPAPDPQVWQLLFGERAADPHSCEHLPDRCREVREESSLEISLL
ncbi:MAG: hypothetical protein WBP79_16795 [Candidatus Acidiferrales bacterium]